MPTPSRAQIPFLVAGVGPIPPESPGRVYAPGLRAWGIARELATAGHPVRLVTAAFGQGAAGGAEAHVFDLAPGANQPGAARTAAVEGGDWAALLAREGADLPAAAAAGTSDVMNHALARSGLAVPMWFDYLGDPMAERQMLAYVHKDDAGIADQWALYGPALARGDRFSGCSRQQCAAILGELASIGRLNQHNALAPPVHLCGPWLSPMEPEPLPAGTTMFRGREGEAGFPEGAFVAVQSGGFNTWLDHETLFAALEVALALAPTLHFALAGGAIPGHFEDGFSWFAPRVAASPHRARYHLLGWLRPGQVPHLIAEADLGLNVDHPCAEGWLGTRSRLLDWALGGLPIVSTPGCELASELAAQGSLRLAPHRDPELIGRAMAEIATAPGPWQAAAAHTATHCRQTYRPAQCLAPLLEWAAAPKPAPDLHSWSLGYSSPSSLLMTTAESIAGQVEARAMARRLGWLERRRQRLEGSGWVRLALKLRGDKDLDGDPEPPPVG